MPVISRRVSLLLLSFAIFLLLAPALFSPPVSAQEASWLDSKTIVPAATQGGIGVIMLIVFVVQSKKDEKKSRETADLVMSLLKASQTASAEANATTKLAFEKYNEHTSETMKLLREEQDYKTELRGTLERLLAEAKIPTKCPILIGKKINIEVTE